MASVRLPLVAAAAGVGMALALRAGRRSSPTFRFSGRTVLVTGGSRGLGLALARQLVAEGARVAICGRDEPTLERARRDLERRGGQVLAVVCDIADRDQVDGLLWKVRERLGTIDVLINNAGVIEVGPVEVMRVEDFEEALKVNFWGAVHTILGVLPIMRARGEGRIVNIASIGGKVSMPHLLPYNTSKFALVGLSEGLRAEVLQDGIVVTTVCPGLMRTGSPRHAIFKGRHRDEYTWFNVADSLPGLSMSAERAARQILDACRRGDAEIILTVPAKIAVRVAGLLPGITADVAGLMNRWLPRPGGIGAGRTHGRESESHISPSWLTWLNERAARRYNQRV